MSTVISFPAQRAQAPATVRVAGGARRPLLGGQLYLEALYAAFYRCECTAWCGRHHRSGEGQCSVMYDPEAPLHVIPGDPGADARRVVDVAQVLVVCAGCHDRRGQTERLGQLPDAARGVREDR